MIRTLAILAVLVAVLLVFLGPGGDLLITGQGSTLSAAAAPVLAGIREFASGILN